MHFTAALAVALSAIAVVTAIPTSNGGGNNCNVGAVQCCNSVQSADSTSVTHLLGVLGLDLGPITGQVGLNCDPISVLGVGGNNCAAQPVCCENNDFNGLINLGCTPVNLNL